MKIDNSFGWVRSMNDDFRSIEWRVFSVLSCYVELRYKGGKLMVLNLVLGLGLGLGLDLGLGLNICIEHLVDRIAGDSFVGIEGQKPMN